MSEIKPYSTVWSEEKRKICKLCQRKPYGNCKRHWSRVTTKTVRYYSESELCVEVLAVLEEVKNKFPAYYKRGDAVMSADVLDVCNEIADRYRAKDKQANLEV